MIDGTVALAATGLVITGERRDAFEERRFPRAVLADDDRHRLVESDGEFVSQERQAERIDGLILDTVAIDPDAPQVGRRQIDDAIAARSQSGRSNFSPTNYT